MNEATMYETTMYNTPGTINTEALMMSWSICLVISVIYMVMMWKIFSKAGLPGWKCLIPFYNMYCLYKILWGNGWMFIALFVPLVNLVIFAMSMYKLAKVFGKGIGFTFGLIFLGIIFVGILAFGPAEYIGD
ncbi:MAG: DUF5684 domain-containing protein [Lachnospiraceae bacterium]